MTLNNVTSAFRPSFAATIVYMLQTSEYDASVYLKWLWRTNDFGKVMYRKKLDRTRPARLLLSVIRIGIITQIAAAIIIAALALHNHNPVGLLLALGIFLATPVLWAHLIVLPLVFGRATGLK
jgi:hypothetical protein